MNRRQVLIGLSATVVVVAGGGIALRRTRLPPLTIADSVAGLQALRGEKLAGTGTWSPFQVFSHLAQSVEFSMQGYPASKPALFQHTVGRGAFLVFSTAGAMRHGLDEPIPGAPPLVAEGDTAQAIDRLVTALRAFESYRGMLAPHFAYGALDRAQYTAAHVMHINNHLTEITRA